ncbi:hypothetical protein M8J77_006449 [Diaphorina citri]|nr:hypothetical protein M8J77_006449 [Diaphorina citri]
MTIPNAIRICFQLFNENIRLSLTILCILICSHQGSSTVVPIGTCILIYSEACPRSEIQFYLFTRNNPNTSELVYFSDVYDNVTASSFNRSLPNKIIVHGYNADMNLDILQNIKTEYFKRGDYNVWFVNWPELCRGPCYVISVYNLEQVGKCVAQMIKRLSKYIGDVEPDMHLIGFSLGAHVAAYTSKYLRPYKLPRITGLDPAMPMFMSRDRDHRLDSEDAKFVDVIHTSAFVQGQYSRSGHVDFYMNGGIEQPGCWNASNPFDCNHRRAPQYFAESINSKEGFWGFPCAGIISYLFGMCPVKEPIKLMGEMCAESSRGFYIAPTKSAAPFAKGPLKTLESSPSKSKISSTSSSENSISAPPREKNKSTKKIESNKESNVSSSRTGKAKKLDVEKFENSERFGTTAKAVREETIASTRTNEIRATPKQKPSTQRASTKQVTSTIQYTSTIEDTSSEQDTSTSQDTTTNESTSLDSITSTLDTSTDTSTIDFTDEETATVDDYSEDIVASSRVSDAEFTDSRFTSKGTEIELLDDNTVTITTSSSTTEKSKYRFIYKVPRPKKE